MGRKTRTMKEMGTMTTSDNLAMRKSGRLRQMRTIAGTRRPGVTLTMKGLTNSEGSADLKVMVPDQNKGRESGITAVIRERTKEGMGLEGMGLEMG